MHMHRGRSRMRCTHKNHARTVALKSVITALVLASLLLASAGCFKSVPQSVNYFALAPENSWLYEGVQDSSTLKVEIKVVKPDPALNLREGIYDVSITGSLGDFAVSEQGLFLEIAPDSVKLWGIKQQGASPQFFSTPYIWLEKPLQVGREYNTAIQGTPTPALMAVTEQVKEKTPWGEKDGFTLQEKSGAGLAGGVKLTFVPYLGFTRLSIPDWPELTLKDASLK
jgi:hypothetical protein